MGVWHPLWPLLTLLTGEEGKDMGVWQPLWPLLTRPAVGTSREGGWLPLHSHSAMLPLG